MCCILSMYMLFTFPSLAFIAPLPTLQHSRLRTQDIAHNTEASTDDALTGHLHTSHIDTSTRHFLYLSPQLSLSLSPFLVVCFRKEISSFVCFSVSLLVLFYMIPWQVDSLLIITSSLSSSISLCILSLHIQLHALYAQNFSLFWSTDRPTFRVHLSLLSLSLSLYPFPPHLLEKVLLPCKSNNNKGNLPPKKELSYSTALSCFRLGQSFVCPLFCFFFCFFFFFLFYWVSFGASYIE